MKRIIDFALICAIVVGVFYACSEDYFAPYEENLELNAHDPRLELIAEIDSAQLQISKVETLSNGESINSGGKRIKITQYQSHQNNVLSLMSTLHVEFYIDSKNNRKITYAAATLPTLDGRQPNVGWILVLPEIPKCKILQRAGDDCVEVSVNASLDYENFFFPDEGYHCKYENYTLIVNPFQ